MEILCSRTILRPADYERTLDFYGSALGLAVFRQYPGGTVFFAGQGLIEIAAHGGSPERSHFSGALWLQVRDIGSATTELTERGVPIVREARTEPWGLIELWVADPDGVPIVLVQVPPEHPLRHDRR